MLTKRRGEAGLSWKVRAVAAVPVFAIGGLLVWQLSNVYGAVADTASSQPADTASIEKLSTTIDSFREGVFPLLLVAGLVVLLTLAAAVLVPLRRFSSAKRRGRSDDGLTGRIADVHRIERLTGVAEPTPIARPGDPARESVHAPGTGAR